MLPGRLFHFGSGSGRLILAVGWKKELIRVVALECRIFRHGDILREGDLLLLPDRWSNQKSFRRETFVNNNTSNAKCRGDASVLVSSPDREE
jgi:hypothetical protein